MKNLNQYRLVGWATFGRNRKPKAYAVTLCETVAGAETDPQHLLSLARDRVIADRVKTDGVLAIQRYDVERRPDGIDIVQGFARAPVMTLTP